MVDYVKLDDDWPTYLHKKLQSDWSLSKACRDSCECYFIRHWERDYFFKQMDLNCWGLRYLGREYRVIIDVIPMEVTQLALSFRAPKQELNLPAYVLVKGISQ
jgi:hypothetical protein